jgi:hypothetical protein
MGFTNFISESEAMHVCGVSAKTLSRFAEAGYLSIEKESDGLTLYSSDELEKVFGRSVVAKRPFRRNGTLEQKSSPAPLERDNSESVRVTMVDEDHTTTKNIATNPEQVGIREEDITPQNRDETETPSLSSHHDQRPSGVQHEDSQQTNTQSVYPEPAGPRVSDISQEGTTSEHLSTAEEATSPTSSFHSQGKRGERELEELRSANKARHTTTLRETALLNEREEVIQLRADKAVLERINEVNEKIIELREERIQEVSKERDWLRERVEKLEQKAERDQILLMSETQLLRQVMEQNAMQRSPVRKALEWIGLIDPPKSPFQSGKERVVLSE